MGFHGIDKAGEIRYTINIKHKKKPANETTVGPVYVLLQKVTVTLAWDGYFFASLSIVTTSISIIMTRESISKSLIS